MEKTSKKIYKGTHVKDLPKRGGGWHVIVQEEGKEDRPLEHIEYHSPDGFAWGYSGSGPADLALSIVADLLGEHPTKAELYRGETFSFQYHQAVKQEFIASQTGDTLYIEGAWVLQYLRQNLSYPG